MNRFIYGLCRALAWFGALVLTAIALMSVASITGRAVGRGPVPGDFELVEAGTALAVFCFLPWCHLKGGHALVDMLWNAYPPGLQRALVVLSDGLMLAVWLLLVWRMSLMMDEYRHNAEVTFILQMPVWWGYAASLPAAAIGLVAYTWRLLEDLGLASPPAGFAVAGGGH